MTCPTFTMDSAVNNKPEERGAPGVTMNIIHAQTPQHLDAVRELFREYEQFLAVDLCFQGFEAELAGLPGRYAAPTGALLLALDGQEAAGCVALRQIEDSVCEMKRLYIRPGYRGHHLGRRLTEKIVEEARARGYSLMRLDTLDTLTEAMNLYASLGFIEIGPYYHNPLPGVVYWELPLQEPDRD